MFLRQNVQKLPPERAELSETKQGKIFKKFKKTVDSSEYDFESYSDATTSALYALFEFLIEKEKLKEKDDPS